jgi:hypothetical protein
MATEIKNEQIEQLTQQFKEMEVADLFKALKAGLTVAQSKATSKKAKAGSMPKGACPPQLKLNNAWVKHVKDYVNQHGWEAFSVPTTTTDKETGAKTVTVEDLPASIMHDGAYIFEGSVTEKAPQGVQVSHKHAMTLSKQWKEGANAHLYEAFAASYDPEEESDVESVASVESVTVVRTTMAEKMAAKAAKDAAAKEAKEAAAAEKAEAKRVKEAKEAAAAELKAQKAMEAEAAKAEKLRAAAEAAAQAEALKAAKVPKAAIVKAAPAKAAPVKAAPVKAAAKTIVKAVVKAAVKAWSCADDGNAHCWEHEGKLYARNYTNDVWECDSKGNVVKWAGGYLPAENRIDETVAEPIYADE